MAKEIILTHDAPQPIGPYSQAVRSGNFLFLSGQIALDPATGNMVNSDITAETRQVMANLEKVLEAGGMDFSNVVKCTIFLKNMSDFPVVNQIYGTFFTAEPPARETVEVSRLPKDGNVEISCIACKN